MITCVTIARNEAFIMPHFARHYKTFCDRIVVYDDDSTDNTREIAVKEGCEVIPVRFQSEQELIDLQNQFVKIYKDCDYLIIVDTDEFLYHPDMKQFLADSLKNDVSAIRTTSFEMFSEKKRLPKLITEIKTGVRFPFYDKVCIVNPLKITETNFSRGRHFCNLKGSVKNGEPVIFLHYKYIGGIERLLEKYADYFERIKQGILYGNHNYYPDQAIKNYERLKAESKEIEL